MPRFKNSLARAMSERMEINGVTYKIASCRSEREDAFRLIHDAYVNSGLMKANGAGMRITPYHLLPTTDLFVAYHQQTVVFTMTMVCDDLMGMPLEHVYGDEVETRRVAENAYLAEVSCLAGRTGHFGRRRMFNVFVNLAALMVQSAHENGVQRLLIACNPRHARFYQNYLGFTQIGLQREYSQVLNKPAIACEHDFDRFDSNEKPQQSYPLKDRIYGTTFRQYELFHQPMLPEEREYFAEQCDLDENHFPLEAV
ncbi:MAG: hypothetical protein AAFN70_12985 [Planctomycetota bacterium]